MKEQNLKYEFRQKNTATQEEFDRFLRKVVQLPLVQSFRSLREVLFYLLYVNLYVDVGARGSELMQLTYGECTFYLAPSDQAHAIVVMISLTHMKCRYDEHKKTVPLHLMNVQSSYTDACRLLFLAALNENCFADFDSWDRLQSVRTRTSDPVLLRMKTWKLQVPVFATFRRTTAAASSSAAVLKPRGRSYFEDKTFRLSRKMGLSRRVTLYSFRRMAIQALVKSPNVTSAQRQQFAGHSSANIFDRWYAPRVSEADMQARLRGQPARSETIKLFNGIEVRELSEGQNTTSEREDFSVSADQPRGSVSEELGREVDLESLLDEETDEKSELGEEYEDSDSVTDDDEINDNDLTNEISSRKRLQDTPTLNDPQSLHLYLTGAASTSESAMMNKLIAYMRTAEVV